MLTEGAPATAAGWRLLAASWRLQGRLLQQGSSIALPLRHREAPAAGAAETWNSITAAARIRTAAGTARLTQVPRLRSTHHDRERPNEDLCVVTGVPRVKLCDPAATTTATATVTATATATAASSPLWELKVTATVGNALKGLLDGRCFPATATVGGTTLRPYGLRNAGRLVRGRHLVCLTGGLSDGRRV